MLHKDMRRSLRRWRSQCVFMRRLKNDWNVHRWNWNYAKYPINSGLSKEAKCSVWAKTTLCTCFYDRGFSGMGRFKDTPHPRCSSYECNQRESSHGLESRPIQEWRELARAEGDEGRQDWHMRRRERDKVVVVRCTCVCGYLMGKTWKRVSEIKWSDRRSEEYCPSCEKRLGKKSGRIRMPA